MIAECLEDFFVNYHDLSEEQYRVIDVRGPGHARKRIEEGSFAASGSTMKSRPTFMKRSWPWRALSSVGMSCEGTAGERLPRTTVRTYLSKGGGHFDQSPP